MKVKALLRRVALYGLSLLALGWMVTCAIVLRNHRLSDPVQYRIWRGVETVDDPAWYWTVYKWAVRPVHLICGSVKVTHPYHWLKPQPMSLREEWTLRVEGDPEAHTRTNNPISWLIASLTWKHGVVIAASDSTKPWQYAWAYKDNDSTYVVQKCTIICKGSQFVFVGPGAVTMVAFDLKGGQIPLILISPQGERIDRDDPGYHQIRKL